MILNKNKKILIGNSLITIALDDFISDGILKESEFRKKIKLINWTQYTNKKILIKGCSQYTIPTWAYLIIVAQCTKYAKAIYFGELKNKIEIIKNSTNNQS